MNEMTHIIKYYATKALVRPIYVPCFGTESLAEKIIGLKRVDAIKIRIVEYKNRDAQVEGAYKRCSTGSERQNANLQILFNENIENEIECIDTQDLIKRLPKAVRDRLERYRADSAVMETEGFEWYEHVAEIEGYIHALVDAGIVLENGAQILEQYCRNK